MGMGRRASWADSTPSQRFYVLFSIRSQSRADSRSPTSLSGGLRASPIRYAVRDVAIPRRRDTAARGKPLRTEARLREQPLQVLANGRGSRETRSKVGVVGMIGGER